MSYQEYPLVSVDTKDIGRLFHLLIINILADIRRQINRCIFVAFKISWVFVYRVYFPMILNLVIVTELRWYEVCTVVISATDVYTHRLQGSFIFAAITKSIDEFIIKPFHLHRNKQICNMMHSLESTILGKASLTGNQEKSSSSQII